jgi:hypothetical protein
MRHALRILGLGVFLALVVASAAFADQTFTDSNGDGGVGTDITTVTVRNDPTGRITIQIASASPIVANHAVAVFIDADRNQATGDLGDEYWMFGGPMVGAAFFAWNGSDSVPVDPPTFTARAAASNVTEFGFAKADIGNVEGFNFAVASISIDPPTINFWDAAPDRGYWSYDLTAPAPTPPTAVVKPVIGPLVATKAIAGKAMTVTAMVRRSDNGAPLTTATMVCKPTFAGRQLAHTESFVRGKVKVRFTVPKAAKGKVVKLSVKIATDEGRAASRVAAFKVR